MNLQKCLLLAVVVLFAAAAIIPGSLFPSTTRLTEVYHISTKITLFKGGSKEPRTAAFDSVETSMSSKRNPLSKDSFSLKPLSNTIEIESITQGTTLLLNNTSIASNVTFNRREIGNSVTLTATVLVSSTSLVTIACSKCSKKTSLITASCSSSSSSKSISTDIIESVVEDETYTETVPCSTISTVTTGKSLKTETETITNTQTVTCSKDLVLTSTTTFDLSSSSMVTSIVIPTTVKSTTVNYITSGDMTSKTEQFVTSSSTSAGLTTHYSTSSISITTNTISSTSTSATSIGYEGDLFELISDDKPSSIFTEDELPLELPTCINNNGIPFQTNKFYANLFLGTQSNPIYASPYNLNFIQSEGMGIQHNNNSKRVFGTESTNNPEYASYYYNPINLNELVFSSSSFSGSVSICANLMKINSVNVQLSDDYDETNYIQIPIVQGMGFATAVYHGALVPKITTATGFEELVYYGKVTTFVDKYKVTLSDSTVWFLYVTQISESGSLTLYIGNDGSNYLEGTEEGNGVVIQVAFAPSDALPAESIYDKSAGMYVTEASVFGQSYDSGTYAEYGFSYTTSGSSESNVPLVFVFPHANDSLISTKGFTGLFLQSATKGIMTGYMTSRLIMGEDLETNIQFLPWSEQMLSSEIVYSTDQLKKIAAAANEELMIDIQAAVAAQNSIYFSGKVLDKFAYILLVVKEVIGDDSLTWTTLEALKNAFEIFTTNQQYYPLIYDTKFGGITSSASQDGDTGADFGSAYYNDHHFHYGYFVHAAAVVGYIDNINGGTWIEDNKWWVNSLVRDVANPSENDTFFPVSRMFDWFSGHSWAAGLFASGDGRNQESSLEDYNFAYGMKLWGLVQGDKLMESRGDLMLSIMKRSMSSYYLFKDDNEIQPSQYIGNKVVGILFENKLAYTTYFGAPDTYPEYVHGIHMLPITPASSRIRDAVFVEQEWDEQISGFLADVDTDWLGILMLNKALYDPTSSYEFFASSSFSSSYLDNGISLTWSLAFSGGLMDS